MKIGLFFGSFNPVHVGHMCIANFLVNYSDLDQVWIVVSPHNPFKEKKSLANDYDRLHLVKLAIGDNDKLKASDIEFSLAKPSYTIDTLTHLKEKHPEKEFSLIMGGDNLRTFHKWKNYEVILANHEVYVYQRPDYNLNEVAKHKSIHILEAPLLQISSSRIRKMIKEEKSIQYMVTDKVFQYLNENPIYK